MAFGICRKAASAEKVRDKPDADCGVKMCLEGTSEYENQLLNYNAIAY